MKKPPTFAVIGGGILGTLTALNISNLGWTCTLFEERSDLWDGATFAGEGKIHLGYVYGKADDETILSLLHSASSFSSDLEFALQQKVPWPDLLSPSFEYGIPSSSLISADEFIEHSHRIAHLAESIFDTSNMPYLGQQLATNGFQTHSQSTSNRFQTYERSVNIPMLRQIVTNQIRNSPFINVLLERTVECASRHGSNWKLEIVNKRDQSVEVEHYDYVINCSWDRQAYLDTIAFKRDETTPNLRLRMFVHGQIKHDPQALTLTLGPFGDFVSFSNGHTYASWYPTGLMGFTESLTVPSSWNNPISDLQKQQFLNSVRRELKPWIPDIELLQNTSVHSRIVVASGHTDIDDPRSDLHQRSGIRFEHSEQWISIKSYKLTSAPSAARAAVSIIKREVSS
jgi:hypothetical protein